MNINKKIFIFLAVLSVFIMLLPISASDNLTDVGVGQHYADDGDKLAVNEIDVENNDLLTKNTVSDDEKVYEVTDAGNDSKIATSLVIKDKNVVKGDYFHVQLLDENGTGIPSKIVKVGITGKVYKCYTNSEGIAKLQIQLAYRNHPVSCEFSEEGYETSNVSSSIFVIPTTKSTISAPAVSIYYQSGDSFKATFKVGNIPLAGRYVYMTICGKTYVIKTDSNGVGTLPIGLKPNTYPVVVEYRGEDKINPAKVTSTVKVLNWKKTYISVAGSTSFVKGIITPFVVKAYDINKSPVAGKIVHITVAGKTYSVRTNANGEASLPIGLKKGSYPISYKLLKQYPYETSNGASRIVVNNPGYGAVWIFGYSMKSISINKLANAGIRDVFLNYYSLNLYGKNNVVNWIKQVNSKGLRVHIWMQVFYDGSWISPVNKDGSIKYSLINSKVNEAKNYARISGVAGVHFDYLRFPGTAYKYKNAVAGINYFTQKAASEIHKINPKCIVSAAIMPEPSGNKYYYGQDAATLSKYLDVIVPMIYKGNYRASTNWIKTTTASFVKMVNGNAQVWAGLQSYRSDDDVTPLSYSQLYKDAQAAKNGGATGVALFRYGLTAFININKLFS